MFENKGSGESYKLYNNTKIKLHDLEFNVPLIDEVKPFSNITVFEF